MSAPRTPVNYAFICPQGRVYRGTGIRDFARRHNLDPANMQHVHAGERRHHKGWRLYEEETA